MKIKMPFIKTYTAEKQQHFYSIFAIQLTQSPFVNNEENIHKKAELAHLEEMTDFINTQYVVEQDRTLALRYIITPNKNYFSKGNITIALFGQTEATTEEKSIQNATIFAQGLLTILQGNFPTHSWIPVHNKKTFEQLWNPFKESNLNVAEIRRREDLILTNTLHPRPALGRQRNYHSPKNAAERAKKYIYYVHNFIPRPNNLNRLLRILLLHHAPLIWQTTIKSTSILPSEETALSNTIIKCEKILTKTTVNAFQNRSTHPPLAQLRARELAENLTQHLLRLKDAPFLMNISLASPAPIPREIVEAVGVEITAPVGNLPAEYTLSNLNIFQMGGYDSVYPQNQQELNIAQQNFSTFNFSPWGPTLAPEALSRLRYMVDASEAACSFRLPLLSDAVLPGLSVKRAKFILKIPEKPKHGKKDSRSQRIFIGHNTYLNHKQPVYIHEKDRRQHMYIVGQTGTGKTTLMKSMILDDIKAGNGLAVIDPHGDLFEELVGMIPEERIDDVVLLDPTDSDYPIGLNILEYQDPMERHFVIREFKAILERLLKDQYRHSATDFAGPVFWKHVQMNLLLVMSQKEKAGTLLQFEKIFNSRNFWRKFVPPDISDLYLDSWIKKDLPQMDYTSRSFSNEISIGEFISGKFSDFLFDPRIRLIFGQAASTINFKEIMDSGKILLVNLAKGELAESNSRFLGMLLMAKLLATAMERVKIPPEKRRMFYLYVDEFQALATENFILLLSEARKFGLSLILANQFLTQIEDPRIIQSIFGNVGSIISFRVSQKDAQQYLAPHFSPTFNAFDLTNLPNWQACVKTTINGQIQLPFSLQTVLPGTQYHLDIARAVKNQSRKKYGRKRIEVEKEIAQSLYFPLEKEEDYKDF